MIQPGSGPAGTQASVDAVMKKMQPRRFTPTICQSRSFGRKLQ